jgi:hypothetical protein
MGIDVACADVVFSARSVALSTAREVLVMPAARLAATAPSVAPVVVGNTTLNNGGTLAPGVPNAPGIVTAPDGANHPG